jgi:hypothetical protein
MSFGRRRIYGPIRKFVVRPRTSCTLPVTPSRSSVPGRLWCACVTPVSSHPLSSQETSVRHCTSLIVIDQCDVLRSHQRRVRFHGNTRQHNEAILLPCLHVHLPDTLTTFPLGHPGSRTYPDACTVCSTHSSHHNYAFAHANGHRSSARRWHPFPSFFLETTHHLQTNVSPHTYLHIPHNTRRLAVHHIWRRRVVLCGSNG